MNTPQKLDISIPGYPRIGRNRELKKFVESYLKGIIGEQDLLDETKKLELKRASEIHRLSRAQPPLGDFSLYDQLLDLTFALGIIPAELRNSGLGELQKYFALARGHQQGGRDFKARPMKKWFTTNYHYVVPRYEADMVLKDFSDFYLNKIQWYRNEGIAFTLHLIGPYTLFALTDCDESLRSQYATGLINSYARACRSFSRAGVKEIHFDESILVSDQAIELKRYFTQIYDALLGMPDRAEIHIHTSFGDARPLWDEIAGRDFDGIGLDLLEGPGNINLLKKQTPKAPAIHAGLIHGKNIWRSDLNKVKHLFDSLCSVLDNGTTVKLRPASSLQYVPYSLSAESGLHDALAEQLAFAEEKLGELESLSQLLVLPEPAFSAHKTVKTNAALLQRRELLRNLDPPGTEYHESVTPETMFHRSESICRRLELQKARLNLPDLPTTTIGSFPQTAEIRRARRALRMKEISEEQYRDIILAKTAETVKKQDAIGFDVLVHGEYERTDMVEYFASHFTGFAFTSHAWVQSYGVRAVKPPIIFGDISRRHPVTVDWISYAQQLSDKPVKAMLTGPVTIYNWSFPAEHLGFEKILYDLGHALRNEILDLERAGTAIIQLDEAALRERLPLQAGSERQAYLETAVRAFRLATSGVRADTQIHTHMCYSDFGSIFDAIRDLDADVITIEAAKSDLEILNTIRERSYPGEIGPGVYDIHSPRIPATGEIQYLLKTMLKTVDRRMLWVNPDCGLKTRGEHETWESLKHMVQAAKNMRSS